MKQIDRHIVVPPDHPSLAGHFPGRPIVPAVVLLDAVLDSVRAAAEVPLRLETIVNSKFLQAVAPGTRLEVRIDLTSEPDARWRARFVASNADTTVLEGSLLLAADADGAA